jgi:hypothetical protein
LSPLAARLIRGDLLEAVYEVGSASEVGVQQAGAFARTRHEAFQGGALELPARRVCRKLFGFISQQGRGGERNPQRCIDLVCNAGDELSERGELLGLDQVRLGLLQLGQGHVSPIP